jgi:S1-C subfamily serine protease
VPPRIARRLRRAVGLPDRDGVLVRHVEPQGPADRAGVREGDLVVSAGGAAVASVDDLHAALDALDALDEGTTLRIRLVRGTDEVEAVVAFEGGGS